MVSSYLSSQNELSARYKIEGASLSLWGLYTQTISRGQAVTSYVNRKYGR